MIVLVLIRISGAGLLGFYTLTAMENSCENLRSIFGVGMGLVGVTYPLSEYLTRMGKDHVLLYQYPFHLVLNVMFQQCC